MESDSSYHLGELALRVRGAPRTADLETEKGQQQTLKAFAKEIGQAYETLKNSYRVAKYAPAKLRSQFPTLSFGHWREITKAGLREEAQVLVWAEKAVEDDLSITQLRAALREQREPKIADTWERLTKKAYRVLEEMSGFDLVKCWKVFPDETGLMLKSLSSCMKTFEGAWAQASEAEREVGVMEDQ